MPAALERGLALLRSGGLPGGDADWAALGADLARYAREIELWNPKLGLVEAGGDELAVKHLLDSLAGLGALAGVLAGCGPARPLSLLDVGSGAGLPGIPLALGLRRLYPELAARLGATLLDRQQRRVGFQLNAKAALGLATLECRQQRLEELAAAGERYDVVCARAFAPLDAASLAGLAAVAAPEGWLFLYKGRAQRVDEELRAAGLERAADAAGAAPGKAAVLPLAVPLLDEERHLVLIRPGAGAC